MTKFTHLLNVYLSVTCLTNECRGSLHIIPCLICVIWITDLKRSTGLSQILPQSSKSRIIIFILMNIFCSSFLYLKVAWITQYLLITCFTSSEWWTILSYYLWKYERELIGFEMMSRKICERKQNTSNYKSYQQVEIK